ncbi:MAG: glycosyltransferase, partial [Candidatus Moranbacteria bacterium]|nr:glycosyltransferase [Candidatus Moranbacteria bacterium]
VAEMDINLAPLEMGNPFCESKSELKWFEAGLVAVPTVAAATQTFVEAIADGVDGYVAHTEREWQEKLERLITHPEERQNMGVQARQSVLARYVTTAGNEQAYYEFLKSKVAVKL